MDTAILSSVIGGSAVVVATLLGVLFNRMFAFQKVTNIQLENVVNAVHGLDTKMKDLEIRLGDKFTGQLKAMDDKFMGQLKAMDDKFMGQLKAMDDKFIGEIKVLDSKFTGGLKAHGERIDRVFDVLRDHGERLALIEAKLNVDPPA